MKKFLIYSLALVSLTFITNCSDKNPNHDQMGNGNPNHMVNGSQNQMGNGSMNHMGNGSQQHMGNGSMNHMGDGNQKHMGNGAMNGASMMNDSAATPK